MYDPGVDRHEWESEWESLAEDLRTDPAHALPELDALVARMLEESGYDLTDPVVREGDEREVVAEYLAAREIVEARLVVDRDQRQTKDCRQDQNHAPRAHPVNQPSHHR